tara:strand:+ start:997 stop:2196 length:1200 start_codon:yes stop_codon:yes gene_type:complete
MTLPGIGNSISFGQIEAEFGQNPGRSLGQYRRQDPSRITAQNPTGILSNSSPSTGLENSALNLPLDDGIPNSGEIKFSQFRGKQLNVIVDYYNDRENLNKQDTNDFTMAATYRYLNQFRENPSRVKVVGGFRQRPEGSLNSDFVLSSSEWQGGKKIIVHVNQTVGGKKDGDVTDVALRTGVWPTGTNLSVDVGPSGYLTGAGGDGGGAGSAGGSRADDGGNGTSALGIEYPATVSSVGVIRCGYGGGGGGSGASNDPSDKSTTDFGRSGGGGGGGAGLPAGAGGAGGVGGFSGSGLINGEAGDDGSLSAGGDPGEAGAQRGATGGKGGAGGDFEAAAEDGVEGDRADDRAYRNTPGIPGIKGSDGKAIYFSSSSVANSSDIDAANVGGRNGGTATGSFN